MNLEDENRVLRVVVPDLLVKDMIALCKSSGSRETGGILIGKYGDNGTSAEVVEVTGPPPNSKSTHCRFRRGTHGLKDLLQARWDSVPRTYYLGEWHFHPLNVPNPSYQDKSQMKDIAVDPSYRCSHPILIILCPTKDGKWLVTCHVFPEDLRLGVV